MILNLDSILLKKVNPSRSVITAILDSFEKLSDSKAAPIRKGWRSSLGTEIGGYLFVGVQTLQKPPLQNLAMVIEDNSIIFPAYSTKDFYKAKEILQISDSHDLVKFFELCNLEYGYIEKENTALKLDDQCSLEKAGFTNSIFDEFKEYSKDLWWQSWGGKLYAINETETVEILKTRSGNFKSLPYWLSR